MPEQMRVITLEGDVRVQRAEELRKDLKSSIDSYEQTFLNVTRLSDIDLSFVHLLYAARRYAKKKKRSLQLTGTFQSNVLRRLQIGGFLEENVSPAAKEVNEALLPLPE